MAEPLRKDEGLRPLYPEPSPTASHPESSAALPVEDSRVGADSAALPSEYAPTSLTGFAPGEGVGGDFRDDEFRRDNDFRNDAEPSMADRASEAADATRSRLRVVAGRAKQQASELKDRAADFASGAGERIGEWKDVATERASQLKSQFDERWPVWKNQARRGVDNARRRTNEVTRRYPLETIAAAAVFGFVAGVVLRVWRSKRG